MGDPVRRGASMLVAVLLATAMLATSGPQPLVAAETPPDDDGPPARLGRAPRLEPGPQTASERRAQRADSAIIDTSSRAAVTAAYRQHFLGNQRAPQRWSGEVASCRRGTISAEYSAAVLGLINYYRNMAGLPGVAFGSELDDLSQAAALIMDANDSLTHYPASSSTCYTNEGYEGASHANLCYNCVGPDAIDAYMHDHGANNKAVGHRRWILFPPQTTLGSGSTTQADALHVIHPASWVRPTGGPDWVSWPPAGFVPASNVYPRFSLSRVGADFGDASVAVTVDGQPVAAPVVSRATGMGDPAVVFEVDLGPLALHQGDRRFAITVDGIGLGGDTVSHSWQTRSFVPVVPSGSLSPGYHSFGAVSIGTTARRTFTVSNSGNVSLKVGTLYFEGAGRGRFGLSQDGCSRTTVGPGSSCSVKVGFSPLSTSSNYATLVVPSDGSLSPSGASVAGSGTHAAPEPTPRPDPAPDPATARTKVVDDKHAGFERSKSGWKKQDIGYARRSFWTPVRRSSASRSATWTARLDAPGAYEVEIRLPKRRATTRKATYKIITADGVRYRRRDQHAWAGRWVRLGTFDFASVGKVKLSDKTGERRKSGRKVAFDAVRFVPASAAASAAGVTVRPEVVEKPADPDRRPRPTQEPAPPADLQLLLFPPRLTMEPGETARLGAWTCPAADAPPFGRDGEPGTRDDRCDLVKAYWSVEHEAAAGLSHARAKATRVTLLGPADTRVIARRGRLEAVAPVLVGQAE